MKPFALQHMMQRVRASIENEGGSDLKPEPPITPVAMGKVTRGVELAAAKDLDERQVAAWMKQAATMPFVGAAKKK